MKEMVGGCCVCSDERGWSENPLVYCDGTNCTVAVHQACYGIVTVPTGVSNSIFADCWLCNLLCISLSSNSRGIVENVNHRRDQRECVASCARRATVHSKRQIIKDGRTLCAPFTFLKLDLATYRRWSQSFFNWYRPSGIIKVSLSRDVLFGFRLLYFSCLRFSLLHLCG